MSAGFARWVVVGLFASLAAAQSQTPTVFADSKLRPAAKAKLRDHATEARRYAEASRALLHR